MLRVLTVVVSSVSKISVDTVNDVSRAQMSQTVYKGRRISKGFFCSLLLLIQYIHCHYVYAVYSLVFKPYINMHDCHCIKCIGQKLIKYGWGSDNYSAEFVMYIYMGKFADSMTALGCYGVSEILE